MKIDPSEMDTVQLMTWLHLHNIHPARWMSARMLLEYYEPEIKRILEGK